jgi:hypothetical protein
MREKEIPSLSRKIGIGEEETTGQAKIYICGFGGLVENAHRPRTTPIRLKILR